LTVSLESVSAKSKVMSDVYIHVTPIASSPSRLFWAFAVAHLLLWTVIPTLVSPNAPLDVIEGYVWGHEWLLGTYKHPPMQAWWLEILALLTGQTPWAYFFASQVAVVIAFWAVWQTGRRIATEQAALIGVLLLEGIVYYNYTSPEFNPNVLQLPFWALIGLFFHRAVKDDRWSDWALLGLWSACGLYTKYSTALILATLGLLMVLHPESRRRLSGKGPYLAIFITVFVFLPHLIWLVHNDFIPFSYIKDRMHDLDSANEYIMRPTRFLTSQICVILPLVFLLLTLTGKKIFSPVRTESRTSFDQSFLNAVVFGPLLLFLLIGLIGARLHDMWGTPILGFSGLWAIKHFHTALSPTALRRFAYGWLTIFIVILASYTGTSVFYPYVTHQSQRIYFPGQALAKEVIGTWDQKYHVPLQYIIGDTWPAGNIAYYPPGRQHVLIDGDYKISPWIKPQDIKQHGAVLVWCIANCACKNQTQDTPPDYVQNFPKAEIQKPIVLARQTGANIPPVTIGWALLPPSLE
jgi:4-amino-4-deoxy-L-arabinose transferase-like glycosyltransferase